MDREAMIYIYNGILLSHKNEQIRANWTDMDEPRICHMEWSQKEKKISYINAYVLNLEKWYWWTYLQGKNRDTDVENWLVDTVGEREGGMNWESSIQIYI